MTPDPVVGPAWLTVEAFLQDYVLRHRCSAFPVVGRDGALMGVVTLSRLKTLPAAQRATTRIEAVMCPLAEVPTAAPGELLLDLLPRRSGCSDDRVLVLQDGRLVGIISPSDIARTLEIAALRHPHTGLGSDTSGRTTGG